MHMEFVVCTPFIGGLLTATSCSFTTISSPSNKGPKSTSLSKSLLDLGIILAPGFEVDC